MRCVSEETARRKVDWQLLIAIAASFGLGNALRATGELETGDERVWRYHVGFTLGGPITRDATHYFTAVEYLEEASVVPFLPGGIYQDLAEDIPRPVERLVGLGSLDQIYASLDKVADLAFRGAKTMADKLVAEKENAYLSYALATIKTDLALPLAPGDLVYIPPGVGHRGRFQSSLPDSEPAGPDGEDRRHRGLPELPQRRAVVAGVGRRAQGRDVLPQDEGAGA